MKNEYISISEFAKRAGVSRQAIYKRLDNELSTYCQLVDNRKVLNIKGLEMFGVNLGVNSGVNSDNQKLTGLTPFEVLAKELEFKDKEIEQLREENRRLSEQLLSLSDKVGVTLQAFSQVQLADKMLESQRMINNEQKKKKWRFWKK